MTDQQTATHTPGPWEVVCVHGWAIGVGTPVKSKKPTLCDVFRMIGNTDIEHSEDSDDGAARLEANARLIAAAPDLLEACERLLNSGPCDWCYEDHGPQEPCECACHREQEDAKTLAASVIAKAKGTP